MTIEEFLSEATAQVRARYPLLSWITAEEERTERLAAQVAESTGLHLARWTAASGFQVLKAHGGAAPALPSGCFDAKDAIHKILQGPDKVLYLLEDFHTAWSDPAVTRVVKDACRALPRKGITLVFVGTAARLPAEIEKDVAVREIPFPTPAEFWPVLARVIESFPAGKRPEISEDLSARMCNAVAGLTENEAKRLFAKVLLLRPSFSLDDISLLLSEKKQIIRQTEMLEFFESQENLETIGGMDELKGWLRSREKAFSEEARKYGLPQPKGLLLLGVQGCGKSLTAKAVSNLWRLPLLRLDFGAVFSSTQAGPDENLRKALRIAESVAPAVLWADEIEKGLAGLEEGSAVAGETARVLGAFLTWMQEKKHPVFVVATANSIERLPPELLRKGRFDEIFFVDLPNVHERKKILEIHLARRGRDSSKFPCDELAAECEKFSGAEIEESIVSGLYEAFAKGRELSPEDVRQALKETVPLAVTQEEKIQALKDWARDRARRASLDTRMLDVFGGGAGRTSK
ncbi:MAG: AAA family ATPase [Bdellovibrionota bacterium]